MNAGYILRGTNEIHITAIIEPNVILGENNTIDAYAVIGSDGEIRGVTDFRGRVVIGDNNHIGEFVTIHRPPGEDEETRIGSNCYIMARCHVPHHATIGDWVTMATGCTIGGHVVVGDRAYLGLESVVHPQLTIGSIACLGMNATVTKNVPNNETWAGVPARKLCWNVLGMIRAGMSDNEIEEITGICKTESS